VVQNYVLHRYPFVRFETSHRNISEDPSFVPMGKVPGVLTHWTAFITQDCLTLKKKALHSYLPNTM